MRRQRHRHAPGIRVGAGDQQRKENICTNLKLAYSVKSPPIKSYMSYDLLSKFRPLPPVRPLILCIEDDSTCLMLRKTFLEQHGYDVIGASTAEEALKLLSEAPVCATITDHFLRGTNGVRLACEMKRTKPEVPIILYSGTVPTTRGKADVFVNKNEPAASFLRILAEVIERYRS